MRTVLPEDIDPAYWMSAGFSFCGHGLCYSRGVNFSLGVVKRALLVISATLLLSVSLSACSGDESPQDATKTPTPTTATPDPKAVDAAAVKDVYERYWAAMAEAENNADPDPKRFADILEGSYGERYLKLVRDYKAQGIVRTGHAVITDLDVKLSGDTATVLACVDEDDWLFKKDGKFLDQPMLGTKPATAEVERSVKGWIITDVPEPAKDAKC